MKFRSRVRHLLWSNRWRKGLTTVVVLVALYAAAGFLLLPALITWQLPKQVAAHTTGQATVQGASVNPFTLDIRLEGLLVKSHSGAPLLGFHSLDINFDLSSIINQAYTFAWIKLDQPWVDAEIGKSGQLNLLQLLQQKQSDASEASSSAQGDKPVNGRKSASLPAVRVGRITINGGKIDFRDLSHPQPFHARIKPINLDLKQFTTQRGQVGPYHFAATIGDGQRLIWQGKVGVNPLHSSGRLQLKNLHLVNFWPYADPRFIVDLTHATLDFSGDYQLRAGRDGLQLNLHQGALALSHFALVNEATRAPVITVPDVRLGGIDFDSAKHSMRIASVTSSGGHIHATLLPDHKIDLVHLLMPESARQSDQQDAQETTDTAAEGSTRTAGRQTSGSPFHIAVNRVDMRDYAIQLTDKSGPQPVELDVKPIHVLVKGYSSQGDQPVTLQADLGLSGGRFSTRGKVHLRPLAADMQFKLDKLDVQPLQPYFKRYTRLQDARGTVTASGNFSYQSGDKPSALEFAAKLRTHHFLGGLRFNAQGQLGVHPLAANVKFSLNHLGLKPFQPYVNPYAHLHIDSGAVGASGTVDFKAGSDKPKLSFKGEAHANEFAATDTVRDKPLVRLAHLAVKGIRFSNHPLGVSIQSIALDKPYARVIIKPDHSTNISAVLPSGKTKKKTGASSKGGAKGKGQRFPVHVKQIVLKDGSANFSDLSLKPRFSTGIQHLHGSVDGFTTKPGGVAKVKLKGKAGNKYAPVVIQGTVSPFGKALSADMGMDFRGLRMTEFSPYSGKFAGYRIKHGKMHLTLHYKIKNGIMQGKNHFVLDQLQLGRKVDSKQAMDLPLKLAIALLKDSNGVIDLHLPIKGNMNDPQFGVGALVKEALIRVIKNVVTAPFHLLAKLVPGGGENLNQVMFRPGSPQLHVSQAKKLGKLADALQQRPQLDLEIEGVAAPGVDRRAMAEKVLRQTLRKGEKNPDSDAPLNRDEKERMLDLYQKRFKQDAEDLVKRKENETDKQYGQRVFLAARKRLLQRITVTPAQLNALADARAKAVRSALINQQGIDSGRVFITGVQSDVKADEGEVPLTLQLNAK